MIFSGPNKGVFKLFENENVTGIVHHGCDDGVRRRFGVLRGLDFLERHGGAYFREAVRQDFGGALGWPGSPVMKSRRVLCLLHDNGLEAAARQAQ